MQSLFHRAHYEFFYRTLPAMLRSPMHGMILQAAHEETGNQYMVGFWRSTAKNILGLSMEHSLPEEVNLTRDDFSMIALQPIQGRTFLVMEGPAPRGPMEAECAVAVFEDDQPTDTLRYFTTEGPVMAGLPAMVGEWLADGSRRNLGGISDTTVRGLFQFVFSTVEQ